MSLIEYFRRIRHLVTGAPHHFPLTVRIFHSVLVISIAALAYNIPLNIAVGLPAIALASALSCALVILLFYLSRYRGKTALSRRIFCFIGTALFIANFFLNSGIDGPTSYFFILMAVIIVAVAPVVEYWYWVGSNIMLLVGLHFIQYYHPQWVPYTYPARADRFIDMSSAYVTVVFLVLACFYMIRKHYDAERLEAQANAARLRELDAEKNKLFSIISHDLRSPLSLIQNYLELLTEFDLSEEERRGIKTQLLASTRGTLDLVNNVLHWSKSQMNGSTVKKELLAVDILLESQVQLFSAIAARKGIVLESVFEKGATVWGSADMVQLIVRNLLNNAIKFTSAGGSVSLNVSRNTDMCLITVEDSGNGRPAQLTEDIFQLSAVTSTGTANEKGVGLGLSLCREYSTLLGGRIWFNSHPESGTTFFVELPADNISKDAVPSI